MCTKLYLNCKKFYQKMLFLCIIFIISDTRDDIYYKSFTFYPNRTQTSKAHFFSMKVFSRIDFTTCKYKNHEEYILKSLGEFRRQDHTYHLHLNRTQTSEAHFFFMKVFSRIDFPIYKYTNHEEYTLKSLGEF